MRRLSISSREMEQPRYGPLFAIFRKGVLAFLFLETGAEERNMKGKGFLLLSFVVILLGVNIGDSPANGPKPS